MKFAIVAVMVFADSGEHCLLRWDLVSVVVKEHGLLKNLFVTYTSDTGRCTFEIVIDQFIANTQCFK